VAAAFTRRAMSRAYSFEQKSRKSMKFAVAWARLNGSASFFGPTQSARRAGTISLKVL
jgi:hypothetical protein